MEDVIVIDSAGEEEREKAAYTPAGQAYQQKDEELEEKASMPGSNSCKHTVIVVDTTTQEEVNEKAAEPDSQFSTNYLATPSSKRSKKARGDGGQQQWPLHQDLGGPSTPPLKSQPPPRPQLFRAEWRIMSLNSEQISIRTVSSFLSPNTSVSAVVRMSVATTHAATLSLAFFVHATAVHLVVLVETALSSRQDSTSNSFTVVASEAIPKGVTIGQYLGRLTLEPPRKDRVRHKGYRLVLHVGPRGCGSWHACIDADQFGTLMGFVNHSCQPSTAFYVVANGREHTLVVVTLRDIRTGEEITASYGNDLWFICFCHQRYCCHRDIQDRSDL